MKDIKIIIHNILGIEHAELNLNDVTMIVGYNCTNKTTILKCCYAITKVLSEIESLNKYADDSSLKSDRTHYRQIIEEQLFKTFGIPMEGLFIGDSYIEVCNCKTDFVTRVTRISSTDIGIEYLENLKVASVYMISSTSILDYYPVLRDSIKLGSRPMATNENGVVAHQYDIDIITDILYGRESTFAVKESDNSASSLNLPIKANENLSLYLRDEDTYRHVSMVGNGVRLFRILESLNERKYISTENDYIFIDEPENGVNPVLQVKLCRLFQKLNCKVIFTTHSSFMLSDMKATGISYYTTTSSSIKEVNEAEAYEFLIQAIGGE
ncbi:MAG: AAA family ATPase [Sarcina sp.]